VTAEPSILRKIFAGSRLKRLRHDRQITQARMAKELNVSPSYLNLMERNQRPITVQVLSRLANVYGIDPREFTEDEEGRPIGEIEQLLADPILREAGVPRSEIQDAADYAPTLLAAVEKLYRAYRAAREANEIGLTQRADPDRTEAVMRESPIDRIRTILYAQRNYFHALDTRAEILASDLALEGRELFHAISERLRIGHGIRVHIMPFDAMGDRIRSYDPQRRQLRISEILDQPRRAFEAAFQLGFAEGFELLNETCANLAPGDEASLGLLRKTLGNYFAGALMMPYGKFLEAAESTGYDVDMLAARFNVSFEQAAHRLTSLARPTARGIPFFMIRIDSAGNVSKRFSSGRFPFAHFGGTCPLWNIHGAFAEPGRLWTQSVELTDRSRWFSIARTVRPVATPHGTIEPCFTVALGCELKYANRLVYAKGIDLDATRPTPIGINCRLCERHACAQRAAPPVLRMLQIDEQTRGISPFNFKEP
jgi:XRE family transcriptional regulator, fatty acid utilization regulator